MDLLIVTMAGMSSQAALSWGDFVSLAETPIYIEHPYSLRKHMVAHFSILPHALSFWILLSQVPNPFTAHKILTFLVLHLLEGPSSSVYH